MQANDSTAKQPRLLSFRKPVNALGSGAAAITDGETAAGVHWDGGPAPAKAVIDLGGYFKISKIRVVTYYGDGRYYHFRALVSTGGGEYVLFGEKTDDTPASAEGTAFSGGPVTGRYVKIEMLKNSANPSVHIAECEVYGVEDEAFQAPEKAAFKADPADLAFGKPVRANSGSAFACFAVDGDPESYWIGENVPKFVDVDLLENYTLEKIVVQTPSLFSFRFRIYGSLNGVDFDHLFDSEEGASIPAEGENTALSFALSASKPYRVVRVMVTGSDEGANQSSMISGIRVYGKKSDAPVIPTRKTLPIPTYRDWLLEKHGVDIAALQDENGFYRPEQTYTEKDTVEALRGLVSRVLGQNTPRCSVLPSSKVKRIPTGSPHRTAG